MESEEADRPPPHPDQALFDITLTCHQLPPGPHRALQEQLGQAISQASEVFTLMGLDADQSLNCARETAWTMIREFGHIGIGSLFCHWPLFLAFAAATSELRRFFNRWIYHLTISIPASQQRHGATIRCHFDENKFISGTHFTHLTFTSRDHTS